MRSDGHYRLYMPEKEESSRLVGFLTLIVFLAVAFGAIVGSAYLYTQLKQRWRQEEGSVREFNDRQLAEVPFTHHIIVPNDHSTVDWTIGLQGLAGSSDA